MARWQRTIELYEEFERARSGDLPNKDLCRIIADRIGKLRPLANEDVEETRLDLEADFRALAEETDVTDEDVNGMMDALYDWGDTPLDRDLFGRKVCWINTVFASNKASK
jgi:hypothetical protein